MQPSVTHVFSRSFSDEITSFLQASLEYSFHNWIPIAFITKTFENWNMHNIIFINA